MADTARVVSRAFGDQLPNPFDLFTYKHAIALVDAAQRHGATTVDVEHAYTHARRRRFREPATYGLADDHRMPRNALPRPR